MEVERLLQKVWQNDEADFIKFTFHEYMPNQGIHVANSSINRETSSPDLYQRSSFLGLTTVENDGINSETSLSDSASSVEIGLTDWHFDQLDDRGYKRSLIEREITIDNSKFTYYRKLTIQPIIFFAKAKRSALVRECERKKVKYNRDDRSYRLRRRLMNIENTNFKIKWRRNHRSMEVSLLGDRTVAELIPIINNEFNKRFDEYLFYPLAYNDNKLLAYNLTIREIVNAWRSSHYDGGWRVTTTISLLNDNG